MFMFQVRWAPNSQPILMWQKAQEPLLLNGGGTVYTVKQE